MDRNSIEDSIRQALTDNGLYRPALEFQIASLASALETLRLARADASRLDCVTVKEIGRWGEKTVPHPVFKIMRDAEASVTKQMKALKLTADDLIGGDDGINTILDNLKGRHD